MNAPRFTCPVNPKHTEFYLRRTYSEAWRVSAQGGIATKEMRNSMDGEGDGPVLRADCVVRQSEAVDATPGDDLIEDEDL